LKPDEDYVIDFNALLGHETVRSVAYAVCYIRSGTDQHGLQIWWAVTINLKSIGTNGSFYVCPADRGPFNFVMITKVWASWAPVNGIKTNDLLCPNSYWYWIAFFSQGSDFAQTPHQRSVSEVKYPSQKIMMECDAADPKDNSQIDVVNGGTLPQAHGRDRFTTLFVDGHASITWYPITMNGTPTRHRTGVWHIDPSGPFGWGMGSLSWIDVP